jgi:WhiB family transcriptional regulator, redox-sensing transcriptional regulator
MSDLTRLPGPVAEHWEWQQHAACSGLGTEKFFHPDGERGKRRAGRERAALAVCGRCPVRADCAGHALRVKEPYGVWGGLSESDREEILTGAVAADDPAAAGWATGRIACR